MGCECSQTNSIVPQQPHVIEQHQIKNDKLEDTHHKSKETGTPPSEILSRSKENQKPKEAVKGKQKENGIGNLEKKTAEHDETGGKQQKKPDEVAMVDRTNMDKAVIGAQYGKSKFSNNQKLNNAKSEQTKEKEPLVVASSKTIEMEVAEKKQPKEDGHRVNDTITVQEFAISSGDKEKIQQKVQSASKIKIKSVKEVKEGSQKSVKLEDNNFKLQHWQKEAEESQLSKTQRLRRADEMQIQREQVTNYLNSVWDYEKEVLNSIISKLQVQEHKKFEELTRVVG